MFVSGDLLTIMIMASILIIMMMMIIMMITVKLPLRKYCILSAALLEPHYFEKQ